MGHERDRDTAQGKELDRRAAEPERRRGVADRRAGTLLDRREWLNQLTGNWDPAILPGNVRIGRDCYLESTWSFVHFSSEREPGLVIGDRVSIYGWTSFSVGGTGLIEVGDDSVLVGATFNCNDRISLGRGVVVSYNVLLADSDMHPVDPDLRRRDAEAISYYGAVGNRPEVELRPIVIEDGVWIGSAAIVLKGVTIGAGARVGAGTVVSRDVPPGATVAGNPARVIEESSDPP